MLMTLYLSADQADELLAILEARFLGNMHRHRGMEWTHVRAKLTAQPAKLRSLAFMEETDGEPDVTGYDATADEYIFFDCSPESPKGRRSICYDAAALESRKEHKPKHGAEGMASDMGIALLNKEQYRLLQTLGDFDTKTSSWIATPHDIRKLGGALFADRRYNSVFVYHNGAESYYAARGFCGWLRV
ncbi:MAG: DUF4256 domain-containing protein [Candidatus Kapabacteria bacterium]|nr:DUF4256 domain-containing protein [Candidatus Kapabacteria bacterium]